MRGQAVTLTFVGIFSDCNESCCFTLLLPLKVVYDLHCEKKSDYIIVCFVADPQHRDLKVEEILQNAMTNKYKINVLT